jgi:PAS domain S-box-containing protein
VIVDDAGHIVLVNEQAEQLFVYDRADLIGQPVEVLLPARLRSEHTRSRERYGAAPHPRPMGSGLDLVARRQDGSEFPVEISLSPLQTAAGTLIISAIRDATERKRAEAELERRVQQRTSHLDALLQFSHELLMARSLDATLQRAVSHALSLVSEARCGAIYLYDPHDQQLALACSTGASVLPALRVPLDAGIMGLAFRSSRVQIAGPAALAAGVFELAEPSGHLIALPLIARGQTIGVLLLGKPSENATAQPVDGYENHPSHSFAADVLATLEGLANLTAAAILEERSVRAAASLSGQLTRLEEQQRTLAERLNASEAGMLQAARLAAVGQLAASIAHEINNPLYAARNCLALLEQDAPPAMRDTPFLGIARDQLTRIAGIIERMREFYRPDRGTMALCDIHHLLEETLAIAGLNIRDQRIHISFISAPDFPRVIGNCDQLRQVFLNLILNAIEAMPEGGTLTVRTIAGPTVALIEIQDTGIGIPVDIRPQLFEPFFTNKPNGTGLGLSISAHIITQHDGQIEVESAEGQGSTFRIALPYRSDR